MRQMSVFKSEGDINIDTVNVHPMTHGKVTKKQTIGLDDDNKNWLDDIAAAENQGASTIGRDAILFYRMFYKNRHKIIRYRKSVKSMVKALP